MFPSAPYPCNTTFKHLFTRHQLFPPSYASEEPAFNNVTPWLNPARAFKPMALSPSAAQNDHHYSRYDRAFSEYGLDHGVYSGPVDGVCASRFFATSKADSRVARTFAAAAVRGPIEKYNGRNLPCSNTARRTGPLTVGTGLLHRVRMLGQGLLSDGNGHVHVCLREVMVLQTRGVWRKVPMIYWKVTTVDIYLSGITLDSSQGKADECKRGVFVWNKTAKST